MTLGASDYDPFVIGNACDPLRIKSLALEQLLEPRGAKSHDQDVAHLLPHQDRYFHVDEWPTRNDTDDQIGHVWLLGVEYTLHSRRIDCPRQSRSITRPCVQKLLEASINQQNPSFVAHERPAGLLMKCGQIVVGERD